MVDNILRDRVLAEMTYLGLQPTQLEDEDTYGFSFDEVQFIYTPNHSNDSVWDSFRITTYVSGSEELGTREELLEVANTATSNVRFAKVLCDNDATVWITSETPVFYSDEHAEDDLDLVDIRSLVKHQVRHARVAYGHVLKELARLRQRHLEEEAADDDLEESDDSADYDLEEADNGDESTHPEE